MLLEKWHLVKRVNADIHVNSSARRLIVFLLDRENSKTKALFPSQERLSEDTNLSVRQVIRGLKSLIDNGYLKIILKTESWVLVKLEVMLKTCFGSARER